MTTITKETTSILKFHIPERLAMLISRRSTLVELTITEQNLDKTEPLFCINVRQQRWDLFRKQLKPKIITKDYRYVLDFLTIL